MKLSILTQTLSDRWMERLREVKSSATLSSQRYIYLKEIIYEKWINF
jgi:hypothetical protein